MRAPLTETKARNPDLFLNIGASLAGTSVEFEVQSRHFPPRRVAVRLAKMPHPDMQLTIASNRPAPVRGLRVDVGREDPYPVLIRQGVVDHLGTYLRALGWRGRIAVVSEPSVGARAVRARRALERAGFSVARVSVPPGEAAKTLSAVSRLWHGLASAGIGDWGSLNSCCSALHYPGGQTCTPWGPPMPPSMPEIAWVMAPPRPCQKVFWCSVSLTAAGSRPEAPIRKGRSIFG